MKDYKNELSLQYRLLERKIGIELEQNLNCGNNNQKLLKLRVKTVKIEVEVRYL